MAIKQECNSNGERVTFAIKVYFFFKKVCFLWFSCEQMFAKATVISFLFPYFMRKSPEHPTFFIVILFSFCYRGFFVVVRFRLAIYCNYQSGMIFAVDMNQPLAIAFVFAPVKYVEWNIVDSNAMKSYKLFSISYVGTFLWVCLCYSHYAHTLYMNWGVSKEIVYLRIPKPGHFKVSNPKQILSVFVSVLTYFEPFEMPQRQSGNIQRHNKDSPPNNPI